MFPLSAKRSEGALCNRKKTRGFSLVELLVAIVAGISGDGGGRSAF